MGRACREGYFGQAHAYEACRDVGIDVQALWSDSYCTDGARGRLLPGVGIAVLHRDAHPLLALPVAHVTPADRIQGLLREARSRAKRGTFFHNFDISPTPSGAARALRASYAHDLAGLDDAAWATVKDTALERVARIKAGAWEPLFRVLNEAKGYTYLASLGCTDISFVPPTYERKTPDLSAMLNGQTVLCEVKTVELIGDTEEAFLAGKFTKIVGEARAQLDAHGHEGARKIVYLILHWGALPGGKAGELMGRCRAFLKHEPFPGFEVEIAVSGDQHPAPRSR